MTLASIDIKCSTNNMYACGFMHSIPAVKEIAGDIPVVADIKIHDGGNGFSVQAQKCGADYSVISTRFNYGCARQAMIAYANTGIKIIGDLCTVPVAEIPHLCGGITKYWDSCGSRSPDL